jgi:hypothetical protein
VNGILPDFGRRPDILAGFVGSQDAHAAQRECPEYPHLISQIVQIVAVPILNPKHCDPSSPRLCWQHHAVAASIILVLPVGVLVPFEGA